MSRGRAVALVVLLVTLLAACSGSTPTPSPTPAPPPTAPQEPLRDVGYWQAKFDAGAAELLRDSRRRSRSTDSWEFYTLAYAVDGYTSMYEATGDLDYARTALSLVDDVVASARPSRSLDGSSYGDDFLGWTSDTREAGGDEVPLYESFLWRYVTRLLRVLDEGAGPTDPAVRADYERLLAFTETDVFDKWFSRGPADTVFRSRTHMTSHWATIALELSRVTRDPDRRTRYLQVVEAVDEGLPSTQASLRGQMRPNRAAPDAYVWSSVWAGDGAETQDVAHGNGDVAYIVEACDLRTGDWTADDVDRLSRTLTAFVLGRDGAYPEFVDGTGEGNGWIADGFVKLGRYTPAVQAALEGHAVQNGQFYAAMAANAAILERGGDRC